MTNNIIKFEVELDPYEKNNISMVNQKNLIKMIMHLMLNSENKEIDEVDINRGVFEGFIERNEATIKYYFSLKNIHSSIEHDYENENDLNTMKTLIRDFESQIIDEIKKFFLVEEKVELDSSKVRF